jgi:hypothetical protein
VTSIPSILHIRENLGGGKVLALKPLLLFNVRLVHEILILLLTVDVLKKLRDGDFGVLWSSKAITNVFGILPQ